MNKIILFNPKSTSYNYRIPNSILAIAASVEGKRDYTIVDGNREEDPLERIITLFKTGEYKYFSSTVMPGPQLKQAIPISKKVKEMFPETIVIWGGYFASNQHKVCLNSGFVDYIINGPGDNAFPKLIESIETESEKSDIHNLIYYNKNEIVKTPKEKLLDQDLLHDLPYQKLNEFYSLEEYLGKTFLGDKTIAYHSSVGCPFTCSFCGIVPIFEGRWKGQSAQGIYKDIKYLKDNYDADAIEFHDNNFFVSEKRTVEFADLIMNDNMRWWGEARIDTMDGYSDESLKKIRDAGCVMIFYGAETGNDEVLKKMDKGGKQSRAQIIGFAERLAKFDIIPEYSFVLGTPADSEEEVWHQLNSDIEFIKEIKEVNPATEIIIYIYSPVPTEGSELYDAVKKNGFDFPEKLEDWLNPEWENFDLRKNPLTPWLTPEMVDRIKNFEVVLNSYYPTVSDVRLNNSKRMLLKSLAKPRYKSGLYKYPYELRFLLSKFKYRQPEIEGF